MKKVLAAAAVATLALTACGGAEEPVQPPMTLTVQATNWSDWPPPEGETPSPQKPKAFTLRDLHEGDTLIVDKIIDELTISIKEVDADKVELTLSEPLAPTVSESKHACNKDRPTLRITRGETVQCSTVSEDAGTRYEFTLE